jgi:hypothetical protein
MAIVIDFYNHIINITSPDTSVDLQTLHDFIEDERCMASPVGMGHDPILTPEGKIEDPTNPGIYSQIILVLQSPWQIQFWGGSGYTRIYGGKLVGGLNDQPVKATGTAGDLTVLESPVDGLTVVTGESGLTSQESTQFAAMYANNELLRKLLNNRQEIFESGGVTYLRTYDDDDATPLLTSILRDKDSEPITIVDGAPSERTRGA